MSFLSILGPVAKFAGSALGFLGQKSANAQNKQLNDPVYIRQRLEEAGYSPALYNGGGQNNAVIQPAFGEGLIEGLAGLLTPAGQQKAADKNKETEVKQQQEQLQNKAKKTTLQPQEGGIYGNSARNSQPVASGDSPQFSFGAYSDLAKVDGENRKVDVADHVVQSGFFEIDNKVTDALGGPIPMLGNDGEVMDIWELAGAGAQMVPILARRAGEYARSQIDQTRTENRLNRHEWHSENRVPYTSEAASRLRYMLNLKNLPFDPDVDFSDEQSPLVISKEKRERRRRRRAPDPLLQFQGY